MKVVCVKWGDRYGSEWVLRLRGMVRQKLTIAHDFECFTDKPVAGIECRPLTSGLPTWWSKLELLKPGTFAGDVLYLDLDVVLTANIDRAVEVARTDKSKLWMRDDFSYSLRNPRQGLDARQVEMLGGHGCCNSSVMVWHGDAPRAAWDQFTPDVMEKQHGDQNHISRVLWPEKIGFLPDDLVGSYKYGQMRGEAVAPITVFHGSPKMNELHRGHPLRTEWEAAA